MSNFMITVHMQSANPSERVSAIADCIAELMEREGVSLCEAATIVELLEGKVRWSGQKAMLKVRDMADALYESVPFRILDSEIEPSTASPPVASELPLQVEGLPASHSQPAQHTVPDHDA